MQVFRLARKKFAEPLSGVGAAMFGARWNSKGIELIYTAQNRSLAMAEVAVHFTWATLPDDYVMLTINVPETLDLQELDIKHLPPNWDAFPPSSATQKLGDAFVRTNASCLLKVPSVVTPGDYNILLNPNHPDFASITVAHIERFPFDKRLFE